MKKWTDRKCMFCEFKERDQVLVKLYQHERIRGMDKSFMRRYEGPFIMLKKIGNVAYKVKLLKTLSQLHPIFHVSLLKSFHKNSHDLSRDVLERALTDVRDKYDKVAEEILAD